MAFRFTVAVDLSKYKHTATLVDTTTGAVSQPLTFRVSEAGFTAFETLLETFSSNPDDFVVGCEATGHYGETLLRRLQAKQYPIVRMNPAQVVQFRRGLGRKAKTDALDAEAMAKQLSVTEWTPDEELDQPLRQMKSLTRLRLDFVEAQSRWINRIRALINQIYPEIEPLLKKLTTPTSMAILSHYPSRRLLAEANLEELTALVQKNSRQNKGADFARQLQQTAQVSVGLNDPCLEVELRIMMQQLLTIADSIHQIEQEIRRVINLVLQNYSERLGLKTPLTLKSFPYGN